MGGGGARGDLGYTIVGNIPGLYISTKPLPMLPRYKFQAQASPAT